MAVADVNPGGGTSFQGIKNYAINPIYGATDSGNALAALMANLFKAAIFLGGLAVLLYFVWGGLQWIMAGSDKGKVEEARNRITNAIIGMAVLVGVVAVAYLLSEIFGINLLNPTIPTPEALK